MHHIFLMLGYIYIRLTYLRDTHISTFHFRLEQHSVSSIEYKV
jgi:hypothetical protein